MHTVKSFNAAVLLLLLAICSVNAQPFRDDIAAFKAQDRIKMPPENAILFVGSSSFRFWKDVQEYFPGYPIINRGFGGSSIPDVIRYAHEIVFPYKAKQVVIYCGENDLAAPGVTPDTVMNRFKTLFTMIRKNMPKANVVYVSIKPSPKRQHLLDNMKESNRQIKEFLAQKKNTAFVDVYSKMLDSTGIPMKDLFIDDQLHMNAQGYAIWQKALQPYLLK